MTYPASRRVAPAQRRSPDAPVALRAGRDDSAGTLGPPGIARIAVDLLGGDAAPAVVVDGALRACWADPDLHLLLVGPAEAAGAVVGALSAADRLRVRTRVVTGAVAMSDPPARGKRDDTTVRSAVRAVADGHADALVSAGPTGATVTAAALGLGRWPQVRRPALVATLPTRTGRVVLLDVGASVDPGSAALTGHADLGAAYAAVVHHVAAPRVGLLSIGTESGKGDRVRRAAEPLLADHPLPVDGRFVGLVEGHEVVFGRHADVVVTDGFTGNVLLKGVEGAYLATRARVPVHDAPRAAVLLGVAGITVVCHGAATGDDLASGIALAADLYRTGAVTATADIIAGHSTRPGLPDDVSHD